jgi:hypothetical protein
MRRLCVVVLALSFGAACPAAASAAATAAASNLLVLNAERGSLVPRGADRFDLTLRGVDRHVTWFADRPRRAAGTASVRTLVRDWADLGFLRDRPNAAIELPDGASGADTLVVELGRPRYDRRADTLRLRVRRITTTASIGGHAKGVDRRLPRRFGRTSLFVDNLPGSRGAVIQVVNDTRGPVGVSSVSLTDGRWDTTPQTGSQIEAFDVAQWSNLPTSPFGSIGGRFTLSGMVTGNTYAITWSWAWGGSFTAQATAFSLGGGGRVSTQIVDQGSPNPGALVVITD